VHVYKNVLKKVSRYQFGVSPVSGRFRKIHPALKHAGYSATTLLPGEDRAAFEKLHRGLIAEFTPVGVLEEHIVADLARLIWRKQNLATFRIADLAEARREKIHDETVPRLEFRIPGDVDPQAKQDARRAADEQARQELGDIHQLIDIGEPATTEGLMKELDIKERLDGMINRCLKQLLLVRGIKSLPSEASSTSSRPQIAGPREAG
jgi:hypothetical protein